MPDDPALRMPGEGWVCPDHGDTHLRHAQDADGDLVRGDTSCEWEPCGRHSWDDVPWPEPTFPEPEA